MCSLCNMLQIPQFKRVSFFYCWNEYQSYHIVLNLLKCCILSCLYNTHSYIGSQCVLLYLFVHAHTVMLSPYNRALCQLISWPGIYVPNRTDLHFTGKTGRSWLRGSFFQPQKSQTTDTTVYLPFDLL